MSLNPETRHNSLFRRKRTKKIPIPVEEHPNYNFIGLIIGPRGKTQKELESKTGCKIAIRGKGSVKEGARGRRDGKVMDGDFEPLHVVITGEDQKSVDAATDMIQQMLIVIDDEKNVHKQAQLRELALLNGTLKEEEFCQICAEKGHRAFECPKRFAVNKTRFQVKCAICGDTSHPTRDCTQKRVLQQGQQVTNNKNAQELDSDYANFMAELDGKKVEPKKEGFTGAPGGELSGITILKPIAAVPAAANTALPHSTLSVEGRNMQPPANTNLPLPPFPTHLPPPQGVVPPKTNLLPPPPPPPPAMQPPALSGVPNALPQLPPPVPNNYGAYNQQQPYNNNNYNYNQQQWQPHQQQQQQQHQQHQQQQNPNSNDETAGWDYKSFYGGGQANSGAGGFNWWEQN